MQCDQCGGTDHDILDDQMCIESLKERLAQAYLQDAEDGVWIHLHAGGQYLSINLSNDPMARKFCLAYQESQPK